MKIQSHKPSNPVPTPSRISSSCFVEQTLAAGSTVPLPPAIMAAVSGEAHTARTAWSMITANMGSYST